MDEGTSGQRHSAPESPQSPFPPSGFGGVTNPVSGLQPLAPKDFQIFINLVEFSR